MKTVMRMAWYYSFRKTTAIVCIASICFMAGFSFFSHLNNSNISTEESYASNNNERDNSLNVHTRNDHHHGKGITVQTSNDHQHEKGITVPTSNDHQYVKNITLLTSNDHQHEKGITVPTSNDHQYVKDITLLTSNDHQHEKAVSYIVSPRGGGDNYVLRPLNTLRMTEGDNTYPVFVLILTYARSGSSWLGSITSMTENSMYVFEPLYKIIYQGFYTKYEVCFYNETCRKPRTITEFSEYAINTFYYLFTCQFSKLHYRTLNVFLKKLRTPTMRKELDLCMSKKQSYQQCLPLVEQTCLKTNHRILKTVRVSMEVAYMMLDLWPNLRIIHLVRDPRGITNSRQNAKHAFSYSKKTIPHSNTLCELMRSDLEFYDLINKKYPGRLKTVVYEALAERPLEGAKFVHNFMQSKLTDTILNYVYNSSHSQTGMSPSYFGTNRSNSTQSAYRWRKEFKLSKVQIVDSACKLVYPKLGFLPLKTKEKLISFEYPSRVKPKNIDGFV
ncbi:Carbohydrate sulfotransferase 1 [Mactra antiquata]